MDNKAGLDELIQALNRRLNRAIEDDQEFRKLSDYQPQRDIAGIYKNRQAAIIIINIFRPWPKDVFSGKTATISQGKVEAKWLECPFPIYPIKIENGITGPDMTKKPSDIIMTHSLYWEYAGLGYLLNPLHFSDLTLDKTLKIAGSFIKGQK